MQYFYAKKFYNKKIIYGFFSRKNGYSKKPFNTLNCSINTKDANKNVNKNIKKVKKKLNLQETNLKFINQVHGNVIKYIDNSNLLKPLKADGMITDNKKISLAILTADCAPIFLIDDKNSTIGAIHVGWRGSLKEILKKSIIKFKRKLKTNSKITAIIGPCLDKKNFEVDKKFFNKFIKKNKRYSIFFKKNHKNNKFFFDMRGLIKRQLIVSSVYKIYHIKLDTYSQNNLFFSHRRMVHSKNKYTGRMINIIGFKQ